MEESASVVRVRDQPTGSVVFDTPHARVTLLGVDEDAPAGVDVRVVLADGRQLAYAPTTPGADEGATVVPDPLFGGNAFRPRHQSLRSLAAELSIAAGRRLETGPESERVLIVLRGAGLVFLENGDTHRFEPGDAVLVPAGEPARVWAQEEDVHAVVLQPAGAAVARRTLAGEIARRRDEGDAV